MVERAPNPQKTPVATVIPKNNVIYSIFVFGRRMIFADSKNVRISVVVCIIITNETIRETAILSGILPMLSDSPRIDLFPEYL